jgi:hypothetical protein
MRQETIPKSGQNFHFYRSRSALGLDLGSLSGENVIAVLTDCGAQMMKIDAVSSAIQDGHVNESIGGALH